MLTNKDVKNFLKELTLLTKKYNIEIWGNDIELWDFNLSKDFDKMIYVVDNDAYDLRLIDPSTLKDTTVDDQNKIKDKDLLEVFNPELWAQEIAKIFDGRKTHC